MFKIHHLNESPIEYTATHLKENGQQSNKLLQTTSIIRNSLYRFQGSSSFFAKNIQQIQASIHYVKNVQIFLLGEEIKPANISCLAATLISGIFFIVPLFCVCTMWWKKIVSQAFSIPLEVYQTLGHFITNYSFQTLTLVVFDNLLNSKKVQILASFLKESQIKEFQLINEAGAFDFWQKQYSQFEKLVLPLKKIEGLKCSLQWFNKKC